MLVMDLKEPAQHPKILLAREFSEVFYNRQRRHSANGFISPVDYETICINKAAVAA